MSAFAYLEKLEDLVGRITTSPTFQNKARSLVSRKLHAVVKDSDERCEIAQEAIGEVRERFLGILYRRKNKAGHIRRLQSMAIDLYGDDQRGLLTSGKEIYLHDTSISNSSEYRASIDKHPLTLYVLKGVGRYCNTRLRRWSEKNEKGNYGVRARKVLENTHLENDFWDEIKSNSDGLHAYIDTKKQLLRLGLDEETIEYLLIKLSGYTFEDLAHEFGGTADKYRRRIERSLDAAGLPPLKELAKIS